jgi:uroporphyrinogen-III decarboxylase
MGAMMTRRERLMATLRGQPVDRPPVSFYEIGGWTFDTDDPDPFNVYNSPDWWPLIRLAEEETDLIRMMGPDTTPAPGNPRDEYWRTETYLQGGARYTRQTLTVAGRTMTSLTRRDPGVSTTWTIEHLLKDEDDVRAYLQLPDEVYAYQYSVEGLRAAEEALGEAGIVMVDVGDPLCRAAALFSPEDYTVLALTEPGLFHQLLERQALEVYPLVEHVARAFPGHLWRIVGSEYASEPFLPPRLYVEYEVRYTKPMVETIHKCGGCARLHSHGRLQNILPHIVDMGVAGLDPVEPPPQGDMALIDVRRQYGRDLVLFGNIEASEIELLPPPQFEARVAQALREGTAGEGRGFVLMPSACPYGRRIPADVLANYETMVRLARAFGG